MAEASDDQFAALVTRAEAGDAGARNALFAALYNELHRLAQIHLHKSGREITLGATTLLHEAYLGISQRNALAFPDRNHFLSYASRAMRGLIIDYVRNKGAQKRGGDLTFTSLDEAEGAAAAESNELARLGQALERLAALDPLLAELVDLKFFCGFSFDELAAMRGVSERTVQRDWAKARVLLHRALTDDA
jgi:RNA polymerase sigma factor (TIGR02999 family)